MLIMNRSQISFTILDFEVTNQIFADTTAYKYKKEQQFQATLHRGQYRYIRVFCLVDFWQRRTTLCIRHADMFEIDTTHL